MKIVFILWTFSDIDKRPGGLEMCTIQLVRRMRKRGHDVRVVAVRQKGEKAFEVQEGIKIYRVTFEPYLHFASKRHFSSHRWYYLKGLARLPFVTLQLWRILKKEKPNVVHMHYAHFLAWSIVILKHFMKFRFVFTLHGYSLQHLRFRHVVGVMEWIFKKLLQQADMVCAPSQCLLDDALEWEAGIKGKIKVIPNGVDRDEFILQELGPGRLPELVPAPDHSEVAKPYIYSNYRYAPGKRYDWLLFVHRALVERGHDVDLLLHVKKHDSDVEKYAFLSQLLKIEEQVTIVNESACTNVHLLLSNAYLYVSLSDDVTSDVLAQEAINLNIPVIAKAHNGNNVDVMERVVILKDDEETHFISAVDRLLRDAAKNKHNSKQRNNSYLNSGARMTQPMSPYILTVANLYKYKGITTLVKAFKKISTQFSQLKLIIVGEGINRKFLERFTARLGLDERVLFLGQARRWEVLRLFKGCEFFILPSWVEPFGIVLLEAMAAGKAIVATQADNIPEIVKEGVNGILVEPRDSDALADGMMRLLNDKDLRERLGKNGRKMVEDEKFSWDRITNEYVKVYEKAGCII